MKVINVLFTVVFILVGLLIFKNWIFGYEIIGGDWPYYSTQMVSRLSFPPLSWAWWQSNGFGGIDVVYSLHIFERLLILGTTVFNIPWYLIYKIFWFFLFLFLSVFSISFLYKIVFKKNYLWQKVIAAFLYLCNTYILLVVSGGQMGYALSYAVVPFVVALVLKGFELTNKQVILKNSIATAITLGFILLIDIRVSYMVLFIIGIYFLAYSFFVKKVAIGDLTKFVVPLIFAGLLNLLWILPLVLLKQDIVSEVSRAYTSVSSLQFFSFADFSHALGLLHPNWPENIFGKVYFMKWEFLILPLLAFSSLLFFQKNKTNKSESLYILFFVIIGLLGAFLAKGANEPFGFIYIWLFEHVPGFVMFRDPTKWYVLIALSYSILVPFTLLQIYQFLFHKQKFSIFNFQFSIKSKIFNIQNLFLLFSFCFLLLLIRPALVGELGGTFQKHALPHEYVMFTEFIAEQPDFFRTMWVPKQSRFSYNSSQHRIIEGISFFDATSSAEILSELNKESTQQKLEEIGVKYLVVPYDSLGEIFLDDRKYNKKEYDIIIQELRQIPWIREVPGFGSIAVFQTENHNDHLYLLEQGELTYHEVDTTQYSIHVETEQPNTIVFPENYNPYWQVESAQDVVLEKSQDGFMKIHLPRGGTYDITLSFTQQQYYLVGFYLSAGVFVVLVLLILMLQYTNIFTEKKRKK